MCSSDRALLSSEMQEFLMDQQCHFTQHLPSTSKLFWAPKFRLNWHSSNPESVVGLFQSQMCSSPSCQLTRLWGSYNLFHGVRGPRAYSLLQSSPNFLSIIKQMGQKLLELTARVGAFPTDRVASLHTEMLSWIYMFSWELEVGWG